jgi:hypothetical protein
MAERSKSQERPTTRRLPSWVYTLLIGLAAWFVLSAWLFAGPGAIDYLLSIVSGFVLIVVSLLLILSRVGRGGETFNEADDRPTFRDRAKWNLEVFQSRLSLAQATMQILLPVAAAALGMTAIGIAMRVVEHSI